MAGKSIPLADRFWSRVEKTPNCWLWQGALTHSGYGHMHYKGHSWMKRAHRVSLELHGIPIPDGMVVDHICRNRRCVNPAHLRLVDHRTNAIENSNSVTAKNHQKTHCHNGHAYATHGFVDAANRRQCGICRPAYKKQWRLKQKQARANASNAR